MGSLASLRRTVEFAMQGLAIVPYRVLSTVIPKSRREKTDQREFVKGSDYFFIITGAFGPLVPQSMDNLNCKNQRFGHEFPIPGSDCLKCGVNQNHINQSVKMVEKKDIGTHIDIIKKRAEDLKKSGVRAQATYKQELAAETAKKLDDLKSIGIYLRLFKIHHETGLLKCREWVLSKQGVKNKGRLFVSIYKKFI